MDIEAPIIPGQNAAGIQPGSPVEEIVARQEIDFQIEEINDPLAIRAVPLICYRSAMVDLWIEEGIIIQIMVHGAYRGKLKNVIGLGSTLADIEAHIGDWQEDEEDNFVIPGLPGLCFEVAGYFPNLEDPALRSAPIDRICVFKPSD